MKAVKRLLIFICASALTASAFADVYSTAIQRAKDVANQNNARQGITPPAPAAPQNTAPPPPPDPVLTATLQNIASLQGDFTGLETDPARKQPLVNDLNAAALGTHPSKSSVSKLADDLAAGLAGKHLSSEQLKKLAQNLHAIANSSHLSQIQEQTIVDEVQKILQGAGVSPDDAAKIAKDVKAIATETK